LSNTSQTGKALVAAEKIDGDVRAAIRRALDGARWKNAIPQGSKVALKVNLGWDLFIPGSITSPLFAELLIEEMRDHAGEIVMVESDQVLEDVEKAYVDSGMADVCRRTGVEWVNMSHAPTSPVHRPDNAILTTIDVPEVLQESLLVTVPAMKTHAKTVITGALKNQWGCLSKMRHEYHLVLNEALADLNSVMRPALAVMDGTIGLEGNGPKSGRPKIADMVLCSSDPVALDTIQAILMGIDPGEVKHLSTCAKRGVGVCDPGEIEVVGVDPNEAAMSFKRPKHNAVSRVEDLLRRSVFKKLFFNTPIFDVCLFGAKNYYRLWTALEAKNAWRIARSHPIYGPQWQPGWNGPSGHAAGGTTDG
jgi:uncharacterized protein (DUF362 family)